MASTLTTSSSTYCSAAEFLKRYDARTIADLCSDSGTPVGGAGAAISAIITALASDANLAEILLAASGKLEAACMAGQRYTQADLALIVGSTGATGSYLKSIVADIALPMCYRRRPDITMPTFPQVEEAERILNALSQGLRIFGLQEVMDAGHIDHEMDDVEDVRNRYLVTYHAKRLFGTRSNQVTPNTR